MAKANYSEEGKLETYEEIICWADLGAAPAAHGQLVFLSVLNIFLSVTAFLGNALILIALRKELSLHPPSKVLLRSLATTDLCVGLIAEPLIAIYWMSLANDHWSICLLVSAAVYTTSIILCEVSLLTMTAISVDRLLALLLGLRYRQVVTLKRTYMIVIAFWVVSAVFSTAYFWNLFTILFFIVVVVSLCLITSTVSYTKIFLTLRHHQVQLQDQPQQPNQTSPLNIAKYKKAVSSAIWLQMTLVVCYLPRAIVAALSTQSELSSFVFFAGKYTQTLVFLNSSLNPILYCWKIAEVRQAVKATIRQVLCCMY